MNWQTCIGPMAWCMLEQFDEETTNHAGSVHACQASDHWITSLSVVFVSNNPRNSKIFCIFFYLNSCTSITPGHPSWWYVCRWPGGCALPLDGSYLQHNKQMHQYLLAEGDLNKNLALFKLIVSVRLMWNCLQVLLGLSDKSTLVQVMARCHQAPSHYLSQCWPRWSMMSYGITRPQWANHSATVYRCDTKCMCVTSFQNLCLSEAVNFSLVPGSSTRLLLYLMFIISIYSWRTASFFSWNFNTEWKLLQWKLFITQSRQCSWKSSDMSDISDG